MTPSGYMEDEACVNVFEILAPTIQALPFIRDYPGCWINIFYDRFKLHVNVAEGLEIFTRNKFQCMKEESANSHWKIIGCLSIVLAQVDDIAWKDSFKIVNLHPHHCVSFNEWLEKIQLVQKQESSSIE
eukprot:4607356-Ditylum_brightwellii.AAC.1